jgi:hypothetical protein
LEPSKALISLVCPRAEISWLVTVRSRWVGEIGLSWTITLASTSITISEAFVRQQQMDLQACFEELFRCIRGAEGENAKWRRHLSINQ